MNPRLGTGGVGTVMVVDDEETIRDAMRMALESARFSVVTASSGQDALDKLAKREIDVMLLDMKMPGLSGLEVLQRLRNEKSDVSVVMVTAFAELQLAVDAMKAGAYDFATKPVNIDNIIMRVVKAHEHRWFVRREKRFQEELHLKLAQQEQRLKEQFHQLIESLAREHNVTIELATLQDAKRRKGLFQRLPAALQEPSHSIEDFVQALFTVIKDDKWDSADKLQKQ